MEDKINRGKEVIAETFDLPKDIIMDIPKIVVTGNDEIIIENHKGISLFSKDNIKVKSKLGEVSIKGKSFEIAYISTDTIIINGKFRGIDYQGDEL